MTWVQPRVLNVEQVRERERALRVTHICACVHTSFIVCLRLLGAEQLVSDAAFTDFTRLGGHLCVL